MNNDALPPQERLPFNWVSYSNPPIVEAVFDIRVQVIDRDLLKLNSVQAAFLSDFPKIKPVAFQSFDGKFSESQQPVVSADLTPLGVQMHSENQSERLVLTLDGMTVGRLKPYENWDRLRNLGRSVWTIYRDALMPAFATRVALRYVNRIDIPAPFRDFRDYLRTYPETSTDLPPSLSAFQMNVQIPYADGMQILINQTIAPSASETVASVILDFDVFFDNLQLSPNDDDELWALFEILRDRKNEAFEACITNNARKLFR